MLRDGPPGHVRDSFYRMIAAAVMRLSLTVSTSTPPRCGAETAIEVEEVGVTFKALGSNPDTVARQGDKVRLGQPAHNSLLFQGRHENVEKLCLFRF